MQSFGSPNEWKGRLEGSPGKLKISDSLKSSDSILRASATGHFVYPVREVFGDDGNGGLRAINDVSPWPQADRADPTQGELAEDANVRFNLRNSDSGVT